MSEKATDELNMAPVGGLAHPDKLALEQKVLEEDSAESLVVAGEEDATYEHPTEEEMRGPNKLRRVSDNM